MAGACEASINAFSQRRLAGIDSYLKVLEGLCLGCGVAEGSGSHDLYTFPRGLKYLKDMQSWPMEMGPMWVLWSQAEYNLGTRASRVRVQSACTF